MVRLAIAGLLGIHLFAALPMDAQAKRKNAPAATPPSEVAVAPAEPGTPPPTKIGAFLAKKGILMVRQVYPLGKLWVDEKMHTRNADFAALVVTDSAPNGPRILGIRVEVIDEYGPVPRSRTSFLDLDEAQGLVKAIDYLKAVAAKHQAEPQKTGPMVPRVDASFTTMDDFEVRVVPSANGSYQLVIVSGSINPVYCPADLELLDHLKGMIENGLGILNSTDARGRTP